MGRILYLGDGRRRSDDGLPPVIDTVVTEPDVNPKDVEVGPDGSIYTADKRRVQRITPDGVVTTFAGTGSQFGPLGDGGPATQARLIAPSGVALAPDGSVYISDNNDQRIRKVDPNGIITTVAGTGVPGFSGDDGPAAQAQISVPEDVAVGSDGTLYIADFNNHRIRRVTREGIISTAVGTGQIGSTGDRGPATEATLRGPQSLAVDQDGSLYIADVQANLIRRVSPDGIITTVAGTGGFGPLEDGIPATQARLFSPQGVTLTADGGFLISEISAPLVLHRVRQVSPAGVINTVAGTATLGSAGDGGPATQAELQGPQGRSVAPDGSLYIAVTGRVRRVFSPLPAFSAATISIASEDGSELYQFDAEGRHLSTLNTLTGAVLFQFAYDARGFLTQITDGDGNVTIIERDASGNPTAIVAPFGQRTSFTLDPNGYLATISNPANETVQLAYSAEGLLETFTDPLAARGESRVETRARDLRLLARYEEESMPGHRR